MPLFPPARREWDREKEIVISTNPTMYLWSPKNWKSVSPKQKMTCWRFAAMVLNREQGVNMITSERDTLDTFFMLALPGTPVQQQPGECPIIQARLANYNVLKIYVWENFMMLKPKKCFRCWKMQRLVKRHIQ